MAVYAIDLPSGGSYEIEHESDDLTQDQVLQVLARTLQGSTPRKAAGEIIRDNPNVGVGRFLDNVTEGIGQAATSLGAASRRLIPPEIADKLRVPTTDDVETLRGVSDEAGFGGTVGNVGTSIATTMVPATQTVQGAQAALRAARLPRAVATLGGAAAGGAAVGALTDPDSATQGAVLGGASSLAGETLGQTIRRLAGGLFRPSEEAKRLMAADIQPTVGQGVDKSTLLGQAVSKIENRLASTPIIGASTQSARARAQDEFVREAIKKAVPAKGTVPDMSGTVDDALANVKGQINQRYRDLFDRVKIKISPNFVSGMMSEADKVAAKHNLNPTEAARLEAAVGNFLSRPNVGGAKPYDLVSVREELYDIASEAKSSQLKNAADDFRHRIGDWIGKNVPKGSAAEYQALNANRASLDRLMDAAKRSSSQSGRFSPEIVRKVLSNRPDPALERLSSDAARVLNNEFSHGRFLGGNIPLPTKSNLVSAALTLGTTGRGTQRLLLGGGKNQAESAEAIRKMIPVLRQTLYESTRSD